MVIAFVYVLSFSISRLPRLLVATADGYLYIYNIDPEEGGDCTLLKQHRYAFVFLTQPILGHVVLSFAR